jgi:hypothetical protein
MLQNEIVYDMPDAEYYADPCAIPSLTQSTARTLLECPALAHLEHPRFGGVRRKPSKEMERGSLIDTLLFDDLLGKPSRLVVLDAPDYRKTATKDARDAALACGDIPVLARELEGARATVNKLKAKLTVKGIDLSGDSQVTMLWSVETSHGPIQCRGRLDHLVRETHRVIIYDLKTTGKLTPRHKLGGHFCDFGYHLQAAAYTQAVTKALPQYAGRVEVRFVVLELDGVNRVRDVRPDALMLDLGERLWGRACETWAECTKSGEWPDGDDGVVRVSPPAWELAKEEARDDEDF